VWAVRDIVIITHHFTSPLNATLAVAILPFCHFTILPELYSKLWKCV